MILALSFIAGCKDPVTPGPGGTTPSTGTSFDEKFDPDVVINTNSFSSEEEGKRY